MTKQEEKLKSFMIPDEQLMTSATARFIKQETIINAVMENNKSCDIYRHAQRGALVVNCENRPRDLPIYGLRWGVIKVVEPLIGGVDGRR